MGASAERACLVAPQPQGVPFCRRAHDAGVRAPEATSDLASSAGGFCSGTADDPRSDQRRRV